MMTKILVLRDKTISGTDELIALFKNNKRISLTELTLLDLPQIVIRVKEMTNHHKTLLIAVGKYCDFAWKLSEQIDSLKALLLIHPQKLDNYLNVRHKHPCMIIHLPDNPFINRQQLTLISRPRPDIAQFISSSNQFLEYQREILEFINQYLQNDNEESLSRIIRGSDLNKMLPAPNPGALRILQEDNITIGIVVPDKNPPFEHINPGFKNEIHYVVSGSAKFRHGNSNEKVTVNMGDFIYVKAFEKHEWTDWSDDFQLIFMQWEAN